MTRCDDCIPHGPDQACTCDGDGCTCDGHVVGCTCDINWEGCNGDGTCE